MRRVLLALVLAAGPALAQPVDVTPPFVPPTPPVDQYGTYSPSRAFRCLDNGRLFSLGDPMAAVRTGCREPDQVVATREPRASPLGDPTVPLHPSDVTVPWVVYVEVETWTYDFGPNRFTQILRFEDGRLVRIEDGPRGTVRR